MNEQGCPFLGTMDAARRRAPHVEFPSFENYCFAGDNPDLIMLGDQATFCLSPACTTCPRYHSGHAHQGLGAAFVPFVATAEDAWQAPPSPALVGLAAQNDRDGGRARWGKLGAGLIFLSVLLCGSLTAVYSGWEWVTRDLRAETAAGRVDVAASAAAAGPTPALYVVMTATPEEQVVAVLPQPAVTAANGAIIPVLPAAVTPTPIRIDPGAVTAATPPAAAPPDGAGTGGEPLVDVELLVPTRRPTPEFDVPTSTPGAPADAAPLPTDTPSLTPTPLGTPIILFGPADEALTSGDCTMVRWNVQNVREVYYENLPMNGQGEREECIKDKDKVFTLLVVLGNGQPQTYTTTVAYLPPTPTITVTPSFTPVPESTPTWTPEPPTPTTPPNTFYAASLQINGSSDIPCSAGQTCDVGLLVTNSGSGLDNLTVLINSSETFSAQLCRADGVCGGSLPILNMGTGNTAFVTARFVVPPDATSQTRGAATFQVRSDGSGGNVMSSPLTVSVTVP
jgi:hypothetical protein